jgi:hypothetical protein
MFYDLIIVSQSKGNLIQVTQDCIDSARMEDADLNVIIVETGEPHKYEGADEYINYTEIFNYNHCLNLGIKQAKGDIYILANNDIIFQPGWSNIGELMKVNGYHSASLISGHQTMFQRNFIYEGYHVGYIFTGWCLFADRYCIEKIGQLDEAVSFWYSDNLYACQLKSVGIKHGLFTNYQIDHLASKTLSKQPSRLQRQYQIGEMHKFLNRQRYYAQREKLH